MSTSFVEYRGRGFWSLDDYLEHLLALLADRIGISPSQAWLADLRDHWRTQSSGDFRAWIHPKLDEFLTSDDRRDAVLTLLDGTASQPDLSREARETARLLQALLRGQITTNASSPLDYMISGSHPYKWSVKMPDVR
jgi:hypothetical protein